jgi:hypothetical protein
LSEPGHQQHLGLVAEDEQLAPVLSLQACTSK